MNFRKRDSHDRDARAPCLQGSDLLLGLIISALLFLLYAETFQGRMYGDGPGIVANYGIRDTGYPHPLYIKLCALLSQFEGLERGHAAAWLLTSSSAALGVGLTFLLCRTLGAARQGALLIALLLAVSPLLWFFATTVENHALHFACVALAALVTLLAPWRRPALAMSLVLLVFPLVYLSHMSGILLVPGWFLLVLYSRTRKAAPFSRYEACIVGILLAGVELLTHMVSNRLRNRGWTIDLGYGTSQVDLWGETLSADTVSFLVLGVLRPLAILLPLVLVALVLNPPRGRLGWTLGALILPHAAFFLWWQIMERGAYFLGMAPFLAVLGSRLPRFRWWRGVAITLTLLVLQASVAWTEIREWDVRERVDERVGIVQEALGGQGTYYALPERTPPMPLYLPGVREENLFMLLHGAWLARQRPGFFGEQFATICEIALQRGVGPIAVDQSYLRAMLAEPQYRPYCEALEEALRRRLHVVRYDHPDWPVLLLTLR